MRVRSQCIHVHIRRLVIKKSICLRNASDVRANDSLCIEYCVGSCCERSWPQKNEDTMSEKRGQLSGNIVHRRFLQNTTNLENVCGWTWHSNPIRWRQPEPMEHQSRKAWHDGSTIDFEDAYGKLWNTSWPRNISRSWIILLDSVQVVPCDACKMGDYIFQH